MSRCMGIRALDVAEGDVEEGGASLVWPGDHNAHARLLDCPNGKLLIAKRGCLLDGNRRPPFANQVG
eukprot:2655977-Lingulodinium_polyedra.AAC.1